MFEIVRHLLRGYDIRPSHMRARVTPGRIYSMMSSDFCNHRKRVGCGCVMPLPYVTERQVAGDCNWRLQPLWTGCAPCQRFLIEIFGRYAKNFDLRDPAALPPLMLDAYEQGEQRQARAL
jgi:hypothetical protein